MKRPEQVMQVGVFQTLIPLMMVQDYKQFLAFHVKNETPVCSKRGAMLGAIAKSMGVMAGVSDTIFIFPNGKMVFVEFKAETRKKPDYSVLILLSPLQRKFRDRVLAMGFDYEIVAAKDIGDALNQVFSILRKNGVKV